MTAKEALREFVNDLTEEQAESLLERLHVRRHVEFEPLTPEQIVSLERGMAQTDAGLGIPHEEVLRRLGRR